MPYFRCANNMFGYCSGEPEFDVEGHDTTKDNYFHGAHCRLDLETCGKYQTILQSARRQADEVKDRIEEWAGCKSLVELIGTLEKEEAKFGD